MRVTSFGTVIIKSPPQPELPSLPQRAVNLSRAIVRHVADGCQRVSDEVQAERMAVCQQCDQYRASDQTCSHKRCGCGVQKKTAWRSERCPLGKW